MTVGIIQGKDGVLHSIWINKSKAQEWLDKQPPELVEKTGWYADEFLVRGTES